MTESEKERWFHQVSRKVTENCRQASGNLQWLQEQMHPYMSITMRDEVGAIGSLAVGLQSLRDNKQLVLADTDKTLVVARLNRPGSLYNTLKALREREISYAQFTHSYAPIPGIGEELELQRFAFERKSREEVASAGDPRVPKRILRDIRLALRQYYPGFALAELGPLLRILWLNNESYVRHSPPRRVAQALWLYQQANSQGGIFFHAEPAEEIVDQPEYRVMFAAGNPPQVDFLHQIMEVFQRLALGVKRAYCLTINNGIHPYFLGTFYLYGRAGSALLEKGAFLYNQLREELYNTQILSTASQTYRHFVANAVLGGPDATLVNALISFCHTSLSHNWPDRFAFNEIQSTFEAAPELTLRLIALFRLRFEPDLPERAKHYDRELEELEELISGYNTGRSYLDETRRKVFDCCLLLIRYTLKTNFFVAEKQALAFRLDPCYLEALGTDFTSDLPPERPFRITFFFGRHGAGYHIGFSDIARGGWRTVLTRGWDDYLTSSNTLFRETYVLAHTQHLKNKDIYEGGSKMVVLLDAAHIDDHELMTRRLYKLQYGFINAFFDIFVTTGGQARDPRVVDYYAEDEPIELGPDENMHDGMIELIADLSKQRGYLLGSGVISSKKAGINHKEFGVTSIGVVKFAEITMAELGIDIRRDPFSVKFTGGPNGDVAGNAMRLLLERCPKVRINLILDGTGAMFDPSGADLDALRQIVLQGDIETFAADALHVGGFLLCRNQRRREGLRELYRKLVMTADGLQEEWLTEDEFYRSYASLIFEVPADLFIPAGGRPETVTEANCSRFMVRDGQCSTRAIVEGANSFLTPDARRNLQQAGVIILRDASANKCGVISSSYEIIGNLLLTEKEFLAHKQEYVTDVLGILERRAEEEAQLIFRRRRETGRLYTEITNDISREINGHYARLFAYFQQHPELFNRPLYRKTLLAHLPQLLTATKRYRLRLKNLPVKYVAAILAGEIAASLVYREDREADFDHVLTGHLQRNFS